MLFRSCVVGLQCKPTTQVKAQSNDFTSPLARMSNKSVAAQQNLICSTPLQTVQPKYTADRNESVPIDDNQPQAEANRNSQSEHVRSVDNQSERSMSIADLSTTSTLFGAGYKWTLQDDALLYSHVNE